MRYAMQRTCDNRPRRGSPAWLPAALLLLLLPWNVLAEGYPSVPLSAAGEPQSLVVVTVWECEAPGQTLVANYENELHEAMDDLGLRVQLVTLGEATSRSYPGRIMILRVKGDATEARRQTGVVPRAALAWTHVSDHDVIPFGTVDMGKLQALLQRTRRKVSAERSALELGRALARVSAHEIYHMITRTTTHSHGGMMQTTLTASELTGDSRPPWLPANLRAANGAFPEASTHTAIVAVEATEGEQPKVNSKNEGSTAPKFQPPAWAEGSS